MRFIILLLIILSVVFVFQRTKKVENLQPKPNDVSQVVSNNEKVSVVAQNLDTPWAIDFLPNGNLLVTQRGGEIDEVNPKTGEVNKVATLSQVKEIGEGGLMGIVLDPLYSKNNFVYLYYTYSGDDNTTLNRVVRMVYKDNKLSDENFIVDNIAGASNHNGGRIKFGPDGNLYITTGDAQNPSHAQNLSSLSGKILRVIGGNVEIYSYGHRNPQGITWDKDGQLWATEHGRSGIASGYDELNRIDQGKNYGWPTIEGDKTLDGMETPVIHSGASVTWAPAGLAYLNGSLFWGGLRGATLYEGVIEGNKVTLKEHYKGEFGRIREVIAGPDNMLYITTSNLDGRGTPKSGDDKIIRISP
jgi:glucose/arabinose dehydrogenase